MARLLRLMLFRSFLSRRSHCLALVVLLLRCFAGETNAAAANSLPSMSVRGPVGVGDQALLASFTIEGPAPRSVLVRAVGPSLATFGVAGVLNDPIVTVHNGAGAVVASNDNWGGAVALSSAFANAGAFPIAPTSRDAALVATLAPGTYTAHVSGAGDTTGVALLEIFDNDGAGRLAYHAARQHVGTGADMLLAGFTVAGPTPQRVLLRALGPALALSSAISNPHLTITSADGRTIGFNDNWSGAEAAAAAESAGLMPLRAGSADAALIMTLAPGNYLAAVAGASSATGLGQFEIALLDGRAASLAPALITTPGAVPAPSGSSVSLAATSVGKPAPTYQWRKDGTPLSGATNSSYTIDALNTAAAGSYSVVLSSSAGSITSQPWTVVSGSGPAAPTIVSQPQDVTLNRGEAGGFTVVASGAGPLTFEWRRDGVLIPNETSTLYAVRNQATTSSLLIFNAEAQRAGSYTVTVRNSQGSVTSRPALLTVTTPLPPPSIAAEPGSVSVVAGETAQFRVAANGLPVTYQWFKDGQPIAGATELSFTLQRAAPADAGSYHVVVTNPAGTVRSRTATLTVSTAPQAPAIAVPPAEVALVAGAPARFAVTATGTSPLAYQWFKDGVALAGRTAASLFIASAGPADAGAYTVAVTNAVGAATSAPARLTVVNRPGPAAYFGTLGNNEGTFALHITAENTGVFLGYLTASRTALVQRAVRVADDGRFLAPAGPGLVLHGGIDGSGAISGEIAAPRLALRGMIARGPNTAEAVAGFYEARESNGSGITYTIVGPTGQSYVLMTGSGAADAGGGTVDASGNLAVRTDANTTIAGTLNAITSTLAARITPPTGTASDHLGGSATRPAIEKLVNISTRGRVGTGADVLIAGFVISGDAPRQILVRGIGPGLAAFGVGGALAAPRLEVTNGTTTLATNAGWQTSDNAASIPAANLRAGAFPLATGSNDAALLLLLPPGGYTAVVSGVNGTTGVALVEVYDVSDTPAPTRKVINLSARAVAGGEDDTLIAGCSITGDLPKRLLVRAVGPTLASAFSVPGTLADPQLRIVRASDQRVIAANDNWSDGGAATQIAEVSTAVGAFALGATSRDAALLINLPPGGYSVVVSGSGPSSGVALVEIYEVP